MEKFKCGECVRYVSNQGIIREGIITCFSLMTKNLYDDSGRPRGSIQVPSATIDYSEEHFISELERVTP